MGLGGVVIVVVRGGPGLSLETTPVGIEALRKVVGNSVGVGAVAEGGDDRRRVFLEVVEGLPGGLDSGTAAGADVACSDQYSLGAGPRGRTGRQQKQSP